MRSEQKNTILESIGGNGQNHTGDHVFASTAAVFAKQGHLLYFSDKLKKSSSKQGDFRGGPAIDVKISLLAAAYKLSYKLSYR